MKLKFQVQFKNRFIIVLTIIYLISFYWINRNRFKSKKYFNYHNVY